MAAHISGVIGRTVALWRSHSPEAWRSSRWCPSVATPIDPAAAPWWLVGVAFFLSEGVRAARAGARERRCALAARSDAGRRPLPPRSDGTARGPDRGCHGRACQRGHRAARGRQAAWRSLRLRVPPPLGIFLAVGTVAEMSGPIGWIAAVVAVTVATAVELLLRPRALAAPDGGAGGGRTDGSPLHTPLAARGDRECRDGARRARADQAGAPRTGVPPHAAVRLLRGSRLGHDRRSIGGLMNLRGLGRCGTPGARGAGPRREHSRAARSAARARRRESPGSRSCHAPAETECRSPRTGPEGDSPLRACRLQRDRAAGVLSEVRREGPRQVLSDGRGRSPASPAHRISACGEPSRSRSAVRPASTGCSSWAAGERRRRPIVRDDLRLLETFAATRPCCSRTTGWSARHDLQQLKEQLRHQAYHDALTGLPNRPLFTENVAGRSRERGHARRVLFLDLDDFKTINDSLGHFAGDSLLHRGRRSRARRRPRRDDVPARLGGDEFAVLTATRGGRRRRARRASGSSMRSSAPFSIGGREISRPCQRRDRLRRPGRLDGRRAAPERRRRHVQREAGRQAALRDLRARDARAGSAPSGARQLRSSGPSSAARSTSTTSRSSTSSRGGLVALEALARWDRPGHGLLLPGSFIPLADEIGLMVEIGSRRPAGGLPAGAIVARRVPRPRRSAHQRQPRAERAARPSPGRCDRRRVLEDVGLPPRPARARDHRERRDAEPGAGARDDARAARARHLARARRLRHRALLARPPARVPARHAQDRRDRSSPACPRATSTASSSTTIVRLASLARSRVVAEGIETAAQANARRRARLRLRSGLPLRLAARTARCRGLPRR